MNNISKKLIGAYIIIISSIILFMSIAIMYSKAGSDKMTSHCAYDSYTLQAMTWRDGRIALDHNYPWLELAVLNDTYFNSHSMNDYEAYRDYFYDENGNFIEYDESEYYVSFPPFPSIPMFLLSFIFGSDTPSNLVGILYGIGAFIFAILLCRKFKLSYLYGICGGILLTAACSAYHLFSGGMSGSVWYMAQLLSLFLTTASFFFIHGNKDRHIYTAFILLGFAVGCRPFQILYYFYFAYVVWKKYNYKFLKTIKFYIPAAIIGICYMVYNYIRFGNIMEFGHNYLPEMMLAPEGQFSLYYVTVNYKDMFLKLPKINANTLEFSLFGFACWITNVLFIIGLFGLILYIISRLKRKDIDSKIKKKSSGIEILILFILIAIHFVLTMSHKSLGMVQFGSRYTIDILPATLMMTILTLQTILRSKDYVYKYLFNFIGFICIVYGTYINVSAAYKYTAGENFVYDISLLNKLSYFIIITSVVFATIVFIKAKKHRIKKISNEEVNNLTE